ncbi:hypothetical protein C7974DRAFT_92430 [Boeremia exigua]|uniref:uncharacterized protein n=1 Tax=Boeremia exigua TaxID=749465 RepID=UPI001E8D5C48|nr:uncharacterized protein C7974DRAFT_92430 [Boeremia exigua]KAH6612173.1 hypothetical protein C7974DRAFT_92430 [Boeremia exigua]
MVFSPTLLQRNGSMYRNLEIRFETPVVSVTGHSEHDSVRVRGRVVFMNSINLRIKSINVALNGIQQVLWHTDSMSCDRIRSKDVVFCEKTNLLSPTRGKDNQKVSSLGPGNHVWPFEFDLKSCPYESIDGLRDTFVRYEVEATIAISGRFGKKISVKKQVKVIRNPCVSEVDDVEPEQDDSGTWPNKLDYHITAPSQNHQWGQPVIVSFKLHALAKGITVESLVLKLQESLILKASSKHRDLYHRRNMIVSEVEATKSENTALMLHAATETLEDHWKMTLPLPRTLRECRQSVRQDRITVAHKLLMNLRLRDNMGAEHHGSHEFPFSLTFPCGIEFANDGTASYPCEDRYLQQDVQNFVAGLCAPPAFGDHASDPIFRPGLSLQSFAQGSEQTLHESLDEPSSSTLLCTEPISRYIFPKVTELHCERSKLPNGQLDSWHAICLDRVPSYDTALRTPEVYTNDFDPSPIYLYQSKSENRLT